MALRKRPRYRVRRSPRSGNRLQYAQPSRGEAGHALGGRGADARDPRAAAADPSIADHCKSVSSPIFRTMLPTCSLGRPWVGSYSYCP